LALLVALLLAWRPPVALADSLGGSLTPPPERVEVTLAGETPIVIRADAIESDRNNQLNYFTGQVSITRGTETITADRAVWSDATNTAEVSGQVKIVTPDFTALSERAIVNLDLHLAKIYEGKAFFPAQNYYLSGTVIERLSEKTLRIDEATATTCDGPEPAWTIKAKSLTLTQGGYALASGVSFNTRYTPVLATPYFMFPVKNERQSGLMIPGYKSSSRDGQTVDLAFFWATGENHDLTYTPVWRSKRGLAHTLEGRYRLEHGRGIWQMTYLSDDEPQVYARSGRLKEARDRYWLRSQNSWSWDDWDVNLNLDLVSDPLYLYEFRNDVDGFNRSQATFWQGFGHTVNEVLNPYRDNALFAQKTGYDTFFRGGVEYTQDLYSEDNHDTIQRLPSLQYNLVSHPLAAGLDGGAANLPRLSLGLNYDYFSRLSDAQSLTDETGHRLQINPSLTWSTPVAGVANLQLDGDLSLTSYAADGRLPSKEEHDSYNSRLAGSLTAALSTTFSRAFDGGLGKAVATRHQLTPTVTFSYVGAPDDQTDLPYWDFLDRRLPRRTARYGLVNTFVSKTPTLDQNGQADGFKYFQFLKIGLWGSYEFEDSRDFFAKSSTTRYYPTDDYHGQGAGPIELDMEAFLNTYFSARMITSFDAGSGQVTSNDLSFRATDPRGDSLTLTYDFDAPGADLRTAAYNEYEEIRGDLALKLNSEWTAEVSTRYDIHQQRSTETYARLFYRNQCYGLGLLYSESEGDHSVGLVIDLLGLGSFNHDSIALASPPSFFYH
jgi:LPS-assembly protein